MLNHQGQDMPLDCYYGQEALVKDLAGNTTMMRFQKVEKEVIDFVNLDTLEKFSLPSHCKVAVLFKDKFVTMSLKELFFSGKNKQNDYTIQDMYGKKVKVNLKSCSSARTITWPEQDFAFSDRNIPVIP